MSNSSILRVFENRNQVWDVAGQAWVAMQQPILNAGSVTVSGTVNQGSAGASPWLTSEIKYTASLEFSGANPIYIGLATPGSATSSSVWQIRKLTFDGSDNVTNIQFAGGSTAFNASWDGRAGLSYS